MPLEIGLSLLSYKSAEQIISIPLNMHVHCMYIDLSGYLAN